MRFTNSKETEAKKWKESAEVNAERRNVQKGVIRLATEVHFHFQSIDGAGNPDAGESNKFHYLAGNRNDQSVD